MSKEINFRSKKLAERLSEALHVADHDPSMALYRIQEHVHKVSPTLVNRKYNNFRLCANIQKTCCDLDSANSTMDQMKNASASFDRVHTLLKNSMFYKQQLDYENSRTNNA